MKTYRVLIALLSVLGLAVPAFGQTELFNSNIVIAGHVNSCADSGTVNTYSCTLDRTLVQYEIRACYSFLANSANTGAATINFSSVGGSPMGAKPIVKMAGGVTTALVANDIRAGQVVTVCYDGTNMQMMSQVGNTPGGTPVGSSGQVQYNNGGGFGGTSGLNVDGTTLLSMAPRITSVTATKTLDTTDGPTINCAPSTASNITLTLPAIATSSVQRRFSVIKTNATTTFGQCLLDGNGSETINGSTGTIAAATQFSRVDCDVDKTAATANWSCVAGKTAIDLTTDVGATVLPVANGGSGAATLTGIVRGNGTSPFTTGAVNLSTGDVTNVLPVANGGTGSATPTRTIYIPASAMDIEGACAVGTAAALVTNGPKLPAITCTDTNTDGIDFDAVFPDGWNGGTITVELVGFYAGTPTAGQLYSLNFSGQCVRSGDAVAAFAITSGATATGSNNVAATLTMVATANLEYHTTSAALTLSGTCAGGAHVYLHGLVNAGTTNLTTIGNLKILGVKLEYARNGND